MWTQQVELKSSRDKYSMFVGIYKYFGLEYYISVMENHRDSLFNLAYRIGHHDDAGGIVKAQLKPFYKLIKIYLRK